MTEARLDVRQTQKLSQSLATAVHLLSLDLDGLSEYMLKAIQENPALEYVPPKKSAEDYAVMVRPRYRSARGEAHGDDLPAPGVTQMEDLEQQLRLSGLPSALEQTAMRMLHLLSPRGYFTEEPETFAAETGIPPELARNALKAIQSLEPVGVGARTVEECLTLQLRERPETDPLCYDLVRIHLLDIGRGSIRAIARETGAPLARVQRCVDIIRGLNPVPCSLRNDTVQYIMPEFSVETDPEERLTIQFFNDFFPTFREDGIFRRLAEKLDGEEAAYAKRMQNSAGQLIRAMEMRHATMEKVARIIVREQKAFFLGEYHLLPLRVDTAAEEIGVHPTTVYRALQDKYLICARGTFLLSYFFQKEVSGGISAAQVKEMIREICRGSSRISDRAISEALDRRGVEISRRTVAKYRAQLDIDSSFRRGTGGAEKEDA